MAQTDDSDFSDLDITGDDSAPPAPDYYKHKTPRPSGKIVKKLLLVAAIIIIVAGLGWGGWKIVKNHKSTPRPVAASTTAQSSVVSDVPVITTTKSYTSQDLNLAVSYPTDWTLSTETDSSIRIVSPQFSYKTLSGANITGYFKVYIRQTARGVDDTYIGRGVAIEPSQSLTYDKPTPTQRQTTYLTNFGLDTPDNFAYFFIAGNFNLNKGDTLGPSYGTEMGTDIIAGGYASSTLKDDLATNEVPVSYFAGTNAYKQAVNIVKSLQLN